MTSGGGTWGAWLKGARTKLSVAGQDDPDALAEFALADLLHVGRADLVRLENTGMDAALREKADAWVERLARGEPLAYVVGWAPFLSHRIRCDRRALIPRPETEELARRALDCRDLWSRPAPAAADIGTGTGCIALALSLAHPKAVVTGVDVSADALDLARENAAALGATGARWMESDGLREFGDASLDAIISNAPYVATGEWRALNRTLRDWEPRLALDGGEDGLDVIRRIIADAPRVLRPGGRIFLEIGETQGAAVRDLIREAGLQEAAVDHDLFGRIRFASARAADATRAAAPD
ncbi:MAG: peptide chain release factor N(5)-glutamine methyltransferase [Kiritimatiellae bacterium]|nr:peptide chain release factor N(5)-glutamine methyltransferase [Kiritimatiellia bacterium]